ncbi:MAG: phosphoribosylformylglycinamidine cyclo-ligase, partial [Candidatus Caldarchaeum sp.]
MRKKITYKEAGVDVEAGDRFVDLIRPLAASTYDDNVVGGVGGFSGFYSLPLGGYRDPVLVSATDGVGTKLKIAFLAGVFDTIGIDLVAMCVNDVVTSGARPLFFLDYIATSKLSLEVGVDVVSGIAEGCRQAGCALLGGETAEMPGFYREGEFDIAGFAVGIVDREKMIRPSKVKPGDKVVGLASSGLHSNGYSLVRKVLIDEMKMGLKEIPSLFDRTLGEILLTPTRIYAKPILALV